MDNRSWMHPYDDQGRRQHHTHIPKSVIEMVDDPFRSLAGELRRQGGFAKDTTPFSEFLWADFLRRQLKRKLVESDFDGALERAMQLAKAAGGRLFARLVRPGAGKLKSAFSAFVPRLMKLPVVQHRFLGGLALGTA